MPVKITTVKAKTLADLEKSETRKIKQMAKIGFEYVKEGYNKNRVRKVKEGYEIDITIHT